jgi:hypothetical protein
LRNREIIIIDLAPRVKWSGRESEKNIPRLFIPFPSSIYPHLPSIGNFFDLAKKKMIG